MYAAYRPNVSYGPSTLSNCCGVPEIGMFVDEKPTWNEDEYSAIEKFKSYGCGIFVSTFLPSQETAMAECEAYHTLLFKTGPHKNKGPDASEEGRTEGVYLCVFKFGKAK